MIIDTNQLQCFVSVHRHGSFSKAAQELNVTQSAISQSVKGLEQKLGVDLFLRNGKKVVITPEGQYVLQFADQLIADMSSMIEEVKNHKSSMLGQIRLGTLMGVGKSWIIPHVLEFNQRNLSVQIKVNLALPNELIHQFENNLLDCLILPSSNLPNVGEKKFLREEYFNLVVPIDTKLHFDEKGKLDDQFFKKWQIITFEDEDTLFKNWCRLNFGQVPKKIKRGLIINSHGGILQAVGCGLGVAVLPTHVLERSYYRGKVKTLGSEFERPYASYYLVYRKDLEGFHRFNEFFKFLCRSI